MTWTRQMVGTGASTDWKANDEAQRDEADTRTTAVTRHVQIGSTEAFCGVGNSIILFFHAIFFGKKSIRAWGNKREKEPGMHALFNINIRRAFMRHRYRYRYLSYKVRNTTM